MRSVKAGAASRAPGASSRRRPIATAAAPATGRRVTTQPTAALRRAAQRPPPATPTPPTPTAAAPARLAPLASAAAALVLLLASPQPALAADGDRERLAEFTASGLLFKDSVEVSALTDRDLPGVTVYLSDFKRSLSDKLSKDFFNEPSQASLSCALEAGGRSSAALASEPTPALAKRLGGGSGVEVFAERKGLNLFRDKTLRVRRIFDADRRTAVYVAFSTRLGTAGDEGAGVSSGRYRTSLCVVPLPAYAEAPAAAAAAVAAAAVE